MKIYPFDETRVRAHTANDTTLTIVTAVAIVLVVVFVVAVAAYLLWSKSKYVAHVHCQQLELKLLWHDRNVFGTRLANHIVHFSVFLYRSQNNAEAKTKNVHIVPSERNSAAAIITSSGECFAQGKGKNISSGSTRSTFTLVAADKAFQIPFSQLEIGQVIAHGSQGQVGACSEHTKY